jgi:hypothetical protein
MNREQLVYVQKRYSIEKDYLEVILNVKEKVRLN